MNTDEMMKVQLAKQVLRLTVDMAVAWQGRLDNITNLVELSFSEIQNLRDKLEEARGRLDEISGPAATNEALHGKASKYDRGGQMPAGGLTLDGVHRFLLDVGLEALVSHATSHVCGVGEGEGTEGSEGGQIEIPRARTQATEERRGSQPAPGWEWCPVCDNAQLPYPCENCLGWGVSKIPAPLALNSTPGVATPSNRPKDI